MADGEGLVAPVAGVIGSPISHSRSPAIFTAAFDEVGVEWTYHAFEVGEGEGGAAIDAMRVLGLRGLSVTMPLKAEALAAVDRSTPVAHALGAVNCVAWDGAELMGHNTDGDGFVSALESRGVRVGDGPAVVLGAGGAARAIVDALGRHGSPEIVVINRSPHRAVAAAELAPVARVGSRDDLADASLVVNATSVGMNGTPGAGELPLVAALLGPQHIVVDIVYTPLRTPLLAAAEEAGAATIDGVGMLVHQAARQFELWTAIDAPIAAMDAAARQTL